MMEGLVNMENKVYAQAAVKRTKEYPVFTGFIYGKNRDELVKKADTLKVNLMGYPFIIKLWLGIEVGGYKCQCRK